MRCHMTFIIERLSICLVVKAWVGSYHSPAIGTKVGSVRVHSYSRIFSLENISSNVEIVFRVSDRIIFKLGFALPSGQRQRRDPYRESVNRLTLIDHKYLKPNMLCQRHRGGMVRIDMAQPNHGR